MQHYNVKLRLRHIDGDHEGELVEKCPLCTEEDNKTDTDQ